MVEELPQPDVGPRYAVESEEPLNLLPAKETEFIDRDYDVLVPLLKEHRFRALNPVPFGFPSVTTHFVPPQKDRQGWGVGSP